MVREFDVMNCFNGRFSVFMSIEMNEGNTTTSLAARIFQNFNFVNFAMVHHQLFNILLSVGKRQVANVNVLMIRRNFMTKRAFLPSFFGSTLLSLQD
jgi:hypothetical protein